MNAGVIPKDTFPTEYWLVIWNVSHWYRGTSEIGIFHQEKWEEWKSSMVQRSKYWASLCDRTGANDIISNPSVLLPALSFMKGNLMTYWRLCSRRIQTMDALYSRQSEEGKKW